MKDETRVSKAIQDVLKLEGVPFIRIQCGIVKVRRGWMHLAEEGYPDWWTALGFIESKTEKGKLSKVQLAVHQMLRHWGHRVEVAHGAAEVLKLLKFWKKAWRHERAMGWL